MNNQSTFWEDLKSGRFASMVKETCQGQKISNSQEVYNVMKPLFAKTDDVECVYCIFLNSQNRILAIEKMFSGTISASTIYTRELVKKVIALKSTAIVLVHNHPSGNIEPSMEDKTTTMKISIALAAIDVALHDHIIIGQGYHSMGDSGFLNGVGRKFRDLLFEKS